MAPLTAAALAALVLRRQTVLEALNALEAIMRAGSAPDFFEKARGGMSGRPDNWDGPPMLARV